MIILYLIILVVAIVLRYYIAKQFESVAADKGYVEKKYFHLCFWLGMVGYLLVIALPDRINVPNQNYSQLTNASELVNHDTHLDNTSVKDEPFIWHPVNETTATAVGESNIKCANCHRTQFKGNKSCNQCGAKFTMIQPQ